MGDGHILFNAVILGNKGDGKSSFGNYILQKTVFTVSDVDTQSPREPCYAKGTFSNLAMTVVDMPAWPAVAKDHLEPCRKMIGQVFDTCENNLHTFFLVIKFDSENSGRRLRVFDNWRQVLGEDVFKKWGIIVITFGDEFIRYMETMKTPDKTFEDWCLGQRGDLLSLFRECNKRIVLIPVAPEQKEDNFRKLLEYIREMPYPYSESMFRSFTDRQRILALQGDTQNHTHNTQEFRKLRNDISSLRNYPSIEKLDAIYEQLKNLKEKTNLSEEEKKTLLSWRREVENVKSSITKANKVILQKGAAKMSGITPGLSNSQCDGTGTTVAVIALGICIIIICVLLRK